MQMSKRTDPPSFSLSSWFFWMTSGAVGVAVMLLAIEPSFAGTASGPNSASLELTLMNAVDYLTGPTAQILGSLAMCGVLYGVIMRSQRGESVASLTTIGIALILIMNLGELISYLPFSVAASMY